MRSLVVPVLVAVTGGVFSTGAALSELGDRARRTAVTFLWASAISGALIAVRGTPDGTWASLGQSPLGSGAASLAAVGAAVALAGRVGPVEGGAIDVGPALACFGVAGCFLVLQSRFLVPCLLYLALVGAVGLGARPLRSAPSALVATGLALTGVAFGAVRQSTGGWALPWPAPAAPPSTAAAVIGVTGCLVLVAGACVLGTSKDAIHDGVGAAVAWPVAISGTVLAVALAGVAIRGAGGAPPGALVALAVAVVLGAWGNELGLLWAALTTVGVALAPGCGPAIAALVGAGAFLGVVLETETGELLGRYGRWCSAGLPGGSLFPGLAVAVVAVVHSTAPGPARFVIVVLLGAAALSRLGSWPAESGRVSPSAVAVGVVAAWLALLPAAWQHGWADGVPRTLGGVPADVAVFGSSLAIATVAAAVIALGASLRAALSPRPLASPRPPGPPLWRRRLGRALGQVSLPLVRPSWVVVAFSGVYGVVSLRLLSLGVRAGFL